MSRSFSVVITHHGNDRSFGSVLTPRTDVSWRITELRDDLLILTRVEPRLPLLFETLFTLFQKPRLLYPKRSLLLSVVNMPKLVCEEINRSVRSGNYGTAV